MTIASDATRMSFSEIESSSPFNAIRDDSLNQQKFIFQGPSGRGRIRNRGGQSRPQDNAQKSQEAKNLENDGNISDKRRFELCILFQASKLFPRQTSGNVVSRLKGKISSEEFASNQEIVRIKRILFDESLAELVATQMEVISLTDDVALRVTELLASIPLKKKNHNQKVKLHDKVLANFQKEGLYLADPHRKLRQRFTELSPEETERILMAAPLQ